MDKNILIELIAQNLTQAEIGKIVGKSATTVRHWLTKYELSTNNKVGVRPKQHKCNKCGETDPSLFYGNDKKVCGDCHRKRVVTSAKEKRSYALQKLGSECQACGFDKYDCSLDVHHQDPSKKDPNFRSMRGWSLKRIEKELESCILLCKNCHAAVHSGYIEGL